MRKLIAVVLMLVMMPALLLAADIQIPENLRARAYVLKAERDGLWEKSLVVQFAEKRRTLGTLDGFVDAYAVLNHSAHPLLWQKVSEKFMSQDGRGGKLYTEFMQQKVADDLKLKKGDINKMATAANMDNLAVVTKEFKPLTVTVLATGGAKSNAIRTGVDESSHIEGEEPKGTINIVLLTNAVLTDGAMARAIITMTEAKTAALEDLKVPSSYTKSVQATGTGTDSVIIVSGVTGPAATYTGGHSKIGELIGKATYEAVVEALGKQNGFRLPGAKHYATENSKNKTPDKIRIALVHFAARPGEVAHNRSRIEAAISEAAARKADWIMTPELAETGYGFVKKIGTKWIENFPNGWIRKLAGMARNNQIALFIGIAERDSATGKLHNSVAVIGQDGVIHGTYRKHRVVNGPAENWATPGQENNLFIVDGIPVGLLICADSYKADVSSRHKLQGARILLSPANWPQVGHMGPNGYWEARTQETGLPLIVNNRTGKEPDLDFSSGESVLVISGRRVAVFKSGDTRIFYLDWSVTDNSFTVVP